MNLPEKNHRMEEDLKNALATLKNGGVIIYPTDTIWGIGCDATNAEAVKRVFEIKNRPSSKAMLVLVDSEGAIQRLVPEVPESAWQLLDVAIDPLTIIYPDVKGVDPSLLAEDGSLAIRITSEKFSRELCRRLRRPLVSTSANISGQASPASFCDIDPEILAKVDYVVNYRREEKSDARPSGIIKINSDNTFKIIR